ncbi:MAG: rhodanese-like domain-containing protein [Cyanothece sp. SIO1E1]|nr:rhodanese-like domain-containing protein [Cyanothece sp. SIO1E1]
MSQFQYISRGGLTLCLIASIGTGATACSRLLATSPSPTIPSISQTALLAQLESDAAPLILDVRTPREYAAGHIPGAINIHYRELPERLDEIRALGKREILVYCERGVRVNYAEATLLKAGFTSILNLTGDMSAWRASGLPVETAEQQL